MTENRDTFRKNNQINASTYKIYFCHKILHVSDIFRAHQQGLSTVNTVIGTPDDGHRTCPKHLAFYDKNKFSIVMHPVGYFYESFVVFYNK